MLRIGSYNILNPFHAVKWKTVEGCDEAGKSNWEWRKGLVLKNLRLAGLDIVCLQEVSPANLQVLKHGTNLAIVGIPQPEEPAAEDSSDVAIGFNPERLALLKKAPFSTGPAENKRHGLYVDLQDVQTGKVIRVCSVHLKGYNPHEQNRARKEEFKKEGYRQLQETVETILLSDEVIIVAGDFNEDQFEMPLASSRQQLLLQQHGFVYDQDLTPSEPRSGRRIDWIFCKSPSPVALEPLAFPQHLAASDHCLVGTGITFNCN